MPKNCFFRKKILPLHAQKKTHLYFMSQYLIFTIIPAFITIIWAFVAKLLRKDWTNSFFVLVAGVTLLANGYAVYHMVKDISTPTWLLIMQLVLSPTVVPQAYAYFCRQLGTKGSKGIHFTLWALLIFLFVPSICIDLQPFTQPTMCEPLLLMHFNIFRHGVRIYSISIPSLIIFLQAVITMARIPVVRKLLHTYELRISPQGRSFILWWALAIAFCVFSSLIEMEQLRQPMFSWGYFITYSVLVSFIFGLIGWGVDLHPIQTTDEDSIDNIDAFVEANKDLAQRAQRLFMEERLYLRPGIVIDDVVKMLGTNRTYFTRMMRAEFDMSFNEYITKERIAYSQTLLLNTDKTIEEIALESGFSNASAFCRVYKRLTDTTPDSWRKSHEK